MCFSAKFPSTKFPEKNPVSRIKTKIWPWNLKLSREKISKRRILAVLINLSPLHCRTLMRIHILESLLNSSVLMVKDNFVIQMQGEEVFYHTRISMIQSRWLEKKAKNSCKVDTKIPSNPMILEAFPKVFPMEMKLIVNACKRKKRGHKIERGTVKGKSRDVFL